MLYSDGNTHFSHIQYEEQVKKAHHATVRLLNARTYTLENLCQTETFTALCPVECQQKGVLGFIGVNGDIGVIGVMLRSKTEGTHPVDLNSNLLVEVSNRGCWRARSEIVALAFKKDAPRLPTRSGARHRGVRGCIMSRSMTAGDSSWQVCIRYCCSPCRKAMSVIEFALRSPCRTSSLTPVLLAVFGWHSCGR